MINIKIFIHHGFVLRVTFCSFSSQAYFKIMVYYLELFILCMMVYLSDSYMSYYMYNFNVKERERNFYSNIIEI